MPFILCLPLVKRVYWLPAKHIHYEYVTTRGIPDLGIRLMPAFINFITNPLHTHPFTLSGVLQVPAGSEAHSLSDTLTSAPIVIP